jgi:hypothetical protein
MDISKCDVIHIKIQQKFNLPIELVPSYYIRNWKLLLIVRVNSMLFIIKPLLLWHLTDRVQNEGLKDVLENCFILLYSNNMMTGPSTSMNGSPYIKETRK